MCDLLRKPVVSRLRETRSAERHPFRRSEQGSNSRNLEVKIINDQAVATGSLSDFIIPMKVGNSAHGDPAEGRESPHYKTHY